jgi:hypothetical protein
MAASTRYIGIVYSGAETRTASLKRLRVCGTTSVLLIAFARASKPH